jgi:hypothetical protein
MIDEVNTTILVGKAECNAWRRDNLLALKHCMDKGSYYEVSFQYVENSHRMVKQVRLIYQIVK